MSGGELIRGKERRLQNGDLSMSATIECRGSLAVIATWVDFDPRAVNEISAALTDLLADGFVLYLKTKSFHWRMSGQHFRDHHLMLDEQADQILAMTDTIAERVRKIGGRAIESVRDVACRQRLTDSDGGELSPRGMLTELYHDNLRLQGFMREGHGVCGENNDVASASILENCIDETERRIWFLKEVTGD
jgi:starvation-inducible DNA-binding protein